MEWVIAGIVLLAIGIAIVAALETETFYLGSNPVLDVKNPKLAKKAVREFFKRAGLVPGKKIEVKDEENVIKATITHKGKFLVEFDLFPEALALIPPQELLAKLAGKSPSEVKASVVPGKVIITDGNLALILKGEKLEPVVERIYEPDTGSFLAGVSLGESMS